MTYPQIFLFCLLGLVFGLLIWGRIRYDLVAFGALMLAVIAGVVPGESAFDGFGHQATIIVALVLVVSRGLSNSGAIELVARVVVDAGRSLFMHISIMSGIAAALYLTTVPAFAGSGDAGFRWLSENTEIIREGVIWNDAIGDGKDRFKSAGVTQSWVVPEGRIGNSGPWFDGHSSAVELQVRGFIATPDNTALAPATDRPFAEYASVGGFLRTFSEPHAVSASSHFAEESRVGIELGYQGDPLPFFEIQDAVHSGSINTAAGRVLDSEVLANLEGRHTWRFHQSMNDTDLEVAPYVQASLGMRENSLRVGGDFIYGSDLEGRTWNIDPAVGALIPGGSPPREGTNWLIWLGGDVGYIGSDAFLNGGFAQNGPSVDHEEVTGRIRTGIMLEHGDFAIAYSMTWLSEEFKTQSHSQVVGAISVKYRF